MDRVYYEKFEDILAIHLPDFLPIGFVQSFSNFS